MTSYPTARSPIGFFLSIRARCGPKELWFLYFVTCKECFVLNSDLTQELKVFSTSVEAQQQLESIPQHHIMAESVINSGTKGGRVMSVSEFQVVEEYFGYFDLSNCLLNS